MDQPSLPRLLRFGIFEVDLRSRELRKNGRPVRLQEQPFQVLVTLLQRPQEIVSREDLRERLWSADTFVDFDNSLNAAVNRVREALGDVAGNPRFIETLPRRGYRFIAPVQIVSGNGRQPTARVALARPRRLGQILFIAAALLLMAAIPAFMRGPAPMRLLRATPLTNTKLVIPNNGGGADSPLLTDGSRLYFSQILQGQLTVQQLAVTGGEPVTIPTPFENPVLFDLSPDGGELLVGSLDDHGMSAMHVWILPTTGGPARRVGDIRAGGAGWSPDGREIVYGTWSQLFVAKRDGTDARLLSDLACECNVFWPRWSPDGWRLRFTREDYASQTSTLWEVPSSGGKPYAVLPEWTDHDNRKGNWTRDGKFFLFDDYQNVWARSEETTPFRRQRDSAPVQITEGPLTMFSGVTSPNGTKFFVVGERSQGEVLRYEAKTKKFERFLDGLSAEGIDFSRDSQWMTYVSVPDGTLWRTRVDGGERLQLTSLPLRAIHPRWSPDGSRIVFTGQLGGKPLNVYMVNADGSNLQALPGSEWRIAPSWSPDGQSLAFSAVVEKRDLVLYDLESRTVRVLSRGEAYLPVWSPDGHNILAATPGPPRLRLFDLRTGQWSDLKIGSPFPGSWAWSRDGKYIYLDFPLGKDLSIQRLRVADGRREQIADLSKISRARGVFELWFGLDPTNAPMVLRDLSSQQIYAYDWER